MLPPPATRVSAVLARKRPLALVAALATVLFLLTSPLVTSQDSTPDTTGAAATPAADATRLELEFTELNDSGVSGTATLYEAGDQTIVEIDLDGTGDDHPTHIHEGTCDTIVPTAAWNLNNTGADGTSTTLIDVSFAELLNGEYVVDLHLAPDQLGLLIACADIAGTPVNAEGTPVAVGGEATETPTGTEPAATETATPDPTATAEPTGTAEADTTPTTTPVATIAPDGTVIADATTEADDGTGGMITTHTPVPGDGTDGGKGASITPLTPVAPTMAAVGGGSIPDGDGTSATGSTVGTGGKGVPLTTSNLPVATGSGDSLLPTTTTGAIVWASGGFALILMMSSWFLRRGELKQVPSRWRRLGL